MPDKKNGCMQKHQKPYYFYIMSVLFPYYSVLFRIIPYNVFGHLAVAMGKGLAWATWQNSENKKCVRLGHLAVAMGKGGGRVACPHQECRNTLTCSVKGWWWPPAIQQTFITCRFHHMLFRYCKHGLCLKCIHTIPSPRLYCISICLY